MGKTLISSHRVTPCNQQKWNCKLVAAGVKPRAHTLVHIQGSYPHPPQSFPHPLSPLVQTGKTKATKSIQGPHFRFHRLGDVTPNLSGPKSWHFQLLGLTIISGHVAALLEQAGGWSTALPCGGGGTKGNYMCFLPSCAGLHICFLHLRNSAGTWEPSRDSAQPWLQHKPSWTAFSFCHSA